MGKVWKPKGDKPTPREVYGRALAGFADTPQEEYQAYEKAMGTENVKRDNYVEALPPIRVLRRGKWVEPDEGLDLADFTTDQLPQIPSIVGGIAGLSAAGTPGAIGGAMIGEGVRRKIGQQLGVGDGRVDRLNATLAGMGEAVPIMASIGTSKMTRSGGIGQVLEQLAKLAKKHGFSTEHSVSGKSASQYLKIRHPEIEREIKIRLSDHELPALYGEPDYDIIANAAQDNKYAKRALQEVEQLIKSKPISEKHLSRVAQELENVKTRAEQIVPQIINKPNGLYSAILESRGNIYKGHNGRLYKKLISEKFAQHYGDAFTNAMRDLENAKTTEARAEILRRLRT